MGEWSSHLKRFYFSVGVSETVNISFAFVFRCGLALNSEKYLYVYALYNCRCQMRGGTKIKNN
jgi:hypothetical protein